MGKRAIALEDITTLTTFFKLTPGRDHCPSCDYSDDIADQIWSRIPEKKAGGLKKGDHCPEPGGPEMVVNCLGEAAIIPGKVHQQPDATDPDEDKQYQEGGAEKNFQERDSPFYLFRPSILQKSKHLLIMVRSGDCQKISAVPIGFAKIDIV